MRWYLLIFCVVVFKTDIKAQVSFNEYFNSLKKVNIDSGITLTFDEPAQLNPKNPTKLILFALPNGNTTAQTFGKKLANGDDWHFDIQHIGAQTAFIRNADKLTNYIVVYIENNLKSWPAWRRKFVSGDTRIGELVADVVERYKKYQPKVTLSSHSGGGSFIFGYINSQPQLPKFIDRIGFLDATYGYETEKHQAKLTNWLKTKNKSLQVIAYNDSVVVYNGKPLVSPTGGTWYRSQLMARDLQAEFNLKKYDLSDRMNWFNQNHLIDFSLIKNPEGKIYHTVLVEKNGFIRLLFNGTKYQDKDYQFWGDRAYQAYVLQ
ncbi:hypothetical protein GM921_04820 [Pedobacter sp. LMG 31464]|uniref:Uncharacterized protein n=1 Tax=Pedobacter planticolens TaxID=2679964 RepID=A0A923IV39_9SPHI|nr:hypothetical protein [Pedobacter planticolens]MBB2144794.1 hypothetical protein [Pedobacter planticolens]